MATPGREMGLDKLELLTKSVFQDVETLKLLGAEKCPGQLRSLQAAFHEGLIIVKTLFNTACPINRLPPEILAHIFTLVPGTQSYDGFETGGHWPFAQTIVEDLHALPKVCRSWRELALATPTLWTTVSTTSSEDDTEFYLRHSIYLPEDPSLELKIHLASSEVDPRMTELLFRNAPRIRELCHVADFFDRELCEVLKSFDANALEKCLLVANLSASSSSTPLGRARFLPFFSGGGTRLRFLCLSGFSFLPANDFPALSSLTLCLGDEHEHPVYWDLWDLLNFVSGTPRLEEIHVCHAPWFATATSSHNTHGLETPVSLPRLRHLSFEYIPNPGEPADVTNVDFLLSHITIPSTCHLYLSVPWPSSSTNCTFLDSVRRHIPDKDRVSHLALRVSDDLWEWDGVVLQVVFPKGSLRLLFPPAPAHTCMGSLDAESLLAFLRARPDTFAWTTELRIHYNQDASLKGLSLLTEALPPIFPNIKLISTIGEKRAELEAGLQLLLQPSAEPSSARAGASAIPYPALETLWVMLNSNELGADAAGLKAALAARAALGFPVRRAVVAYRVPESQAPELRWDDVRNLIALEGVVDEVVPMGIPSGERPEEVDWMVWYPEKYGLPADIRRDWPVWSRSG